MATFKDVLVFLCEPSFSSSRITQGLNALLFERAPLLLNNLKWLLYLNPCLGAIHSYPFR